MKIAYIITRSDSIGGAQRHVLDLAKGQRPFCNQVVVLVGGNGPFAEELEKSDISVVSVKNLKRSINPFRDLLALLEIRDILKSEAPDLVHAHSSKAGALGRLAAKSLGIPAIFTVHGWAFSGGRNSLSRVVYCLFEATMALSSTKIIAVSDYDYRLGLKWVSCNPKKIVRIHNGIPDQNQILRAKPGEKPVNIISVARFEPQKDHVTLLEALSELKDIDIPWSLHLIGEGPDRAKIEDLASDLGLMEKVRFWGFRADVQEMLAESQLFVLISNYEGFPLTILEAMRAGLPVVASDVGGVREALVEGKTGYLIPKSNSLILEARLETLLKDPHLRVAMGNEGRNRYETYFTLDRMLEETTRVYENIILDSSEHLPDSADKNCNI